MHKCLQLTITVWAMSDKSKLSVALIRTLSRLKMEVVPNSCLTSQEFFKHCSKTELSKTTKCLLLKQIARNAKTTIKSVHKQKKLKWPEDRRIH